MQIAFDDAARTMDRVQTALATGKSFDCIEYLDGSNDEIPDNRGVQAYLLPNKLLVIPGTNELLDWARFNLNLSKHHADEDTELPKVARDSGRLWHAGFLNHARFVYPLAKRHPIDFIIGHSLGGASAQILGSSLKIPTITFGSPRPSCDESDIDGSAWVINLCRSDDRVCRVPPKKFGWKHVGSHIRLKPPGPNLGNDHGMKNYITAIEDQYSETLPPYWPYFGA